MGVYSVTEIQGWRRCRRKAYAGSFNGMAKTPVMSAPALRMGSIWHKGMEWWMEPTAEDYPNELGLGQPCYKLMRIAAERQFKAIEDAASEVLGVGLDEETKYKMSLEKDMLEAMAMNYESVWGSPLPAGYTAIKAEQTLIVDIPGTEHFECTNHHIGVFEVGRHFYNDTFACIACGERATVQCHRLECTLDGLIMHTETSRLYILERKTYENRPNMQYLQKNDQYKAYMWAAKQLGMEIFGAAYDGAWKRARPANKNIQMADLFLRLTITHSDPEIESYGEWLTEVAPEMARCYQAPFDSPINYPNPRWEGCWDCDLTNKEGTGVCDMMDAKNQSMVDFLLQTEYTKRAPHGRELVWPGHIDLAVKEES